MKRILFAITFSMISLASFAVTTLNVTSSDNASVFNIHYKGAEKNNVTVTILDERNHMIFSEVIYRVASFVRPYNFENVRPGEYTIVIEDKNGKQVEKIKYALETVQSYVNITTVPNKENKFWLFASSSKADAMAVTILNEDGTVLHEQTIEVAGTFSTVFDLSQVKKLSGVTFEVVDANGKVYQAKF